MAPAAARFEAAKAIFRRKETRRREGVQGFAGFRQFLFVEFVGAVFVAAVLF